MKKFLPMGYIILESYDDIAYLIFLCKTEIILLTSVTSESISIHTEVYTSEDVILFSTNNGIQ